MRFDVWLCWSRDRAFIRSGRKHGQWLDWIDRIRLCDMVIGRDESCLVCVLCLGKSIAFKKALQLAFDRYFIFDPSSECGLFCGSLLVAHLK